MPAYLLAAFCIPASRAPQGAVDVLVRLVGESVAGSGEARSREQVLAEQAAFINRILARAPNAEVTARCSSPLNAVVLRSRRRGSAGLARDTAITRVVASATTAWTFRKPCRTSARIPRMTSALVARACASPSSTAASTTRTSPGWSGTQAAYEAAWAPLPPAGRRPFPQSPAGTGYLVLDDPGTTADDGLFPSSKVIGGYDFVGEDVAEHADSPLPDPDPIGAPDATTNGGHGTHVADIIAGKLGVAPAAKLYALKACSAPATSCSG